ncbi:MAG: phycobilisome rod-core linker polypeptide [Cyanobacteria bacterium P01_H01_bin.15]
MVIPLLEYAPKTQNARVSGYEIAGDDQPKIYSTEYLFSPDDIAELIEAAYRQFFFHAFATDREPFLESQLKNGQITVRDFVRGLLLSDTYRRSFYELNSNYRFVEQTVQRVLGRDTYNEREKIAWSIVVATKGIVGFVDTLLDSDEYLGNFGDSILPYQRRRVLPSRERGETPFNIQSPRYDEYYRSILGFPKFVGTVQPRRFKKPATSLDLVPGNPALYMDLAKTISPLTAGPSVSIPSGMSFLDKVPYRKSESANG